MGTTENTKKLKDFIAKKFENGELDNDSLVQLIALCGSYLNIKSIAEYAKENDMSYNGVKKFRNIVTIFNQKFVVDND